MKIADIYSFLDTLSPFGLQEKWDSSGLNIGSMQSEITKIYLSLDIDAELLDAVEDGSLIITHHPLIFDPLDQLDFDKYPASLVERMVKKNISHIAMHTNFDKTHLNRYVFETILELQPEENPKDVYILEAKVTMTQKELLELLSQKLGLKSFKIVNAKEQINSLALVTGSGASMMDHLKSECFLTGDIKYHDAIKAKMQNLMMVDIGHYESERFFVDIMADELQVLPIPAIISNSKNPFTNQNL